MLTCPECGGALWQVGEPGLVHFRCHVGHALSGQALLRAQAEALEKALWCAARTLTDQATLARQLATEARRRGSEDAAAAAEFEAQAVAAEWQGQALRRLIESGADAAV